MTPMRLPDPVPVVSTHAGRPTVLVTGTSSGIGLATAIALAGAGWQTVATVRDPARVDRLREAASAAAVQLDIRRLDVTDAASVATCFEGIVADHGRLDALVNNAGAAHVGTVESDDMNQFRSCIEVNFFGVVSVTRTAMPLLRASSGRIVTISSVGGVVGQPFNEAYCAAKFAVEGFFEALAPVAAAVGVRVSVVEPGAVDSEFVSNASLDPDVMIAAAGPYADVLGRYLDRTIKQFGSAAQPASEVAALITALLADPSPVFRVQTSQWSRDFVATKLTDLDGSAVLGMTSSWVR
jgi:NAD(P)-dependent dehydrogenase (short-subunit alcohol dehydrogenase family)